MPVPYSHPSVEGYTTTPSHNHSCSAKRAQIARWFVFWCTWSCAATHINTWVVSHKSERHDSLILLHLSFRCVVSHKSESCHKEWVMSHKSESCHTRVRDMTHLFSCISHSDVLCHTRVSHVTQEWVMSHKSESCHTRVSHVTQEWVMSHKSESCHTRVSHVTQGWVMSHKSESCHTSVSDMTYISHSDVLCHISSESCHTSVSHVTQEWAMSHKCEWHKCEWHKCEWHDSPLSFRCVMSHLNERCNMWMSHVTRTNESCQTCKWVISPPHEWVMSHKVESCHTRVSDMTHISHSDVSCHNACHMSHVIIHVWMSHVTRMNESCHTYKWVISHIWMSHVTHTNACICAATWLSARGIVWCKWSCHRYMRHVTRMNESCRTRMNESCHTYECMRLCRNLAWWLQLVGSLKL